MAIGNNTMVSLAALLVAMMKAMVSFNRKKCTNLRWAEEWETFSWKITETFLDLKPAQLIDFTYIVTHEQFH